MRRLLSNRALRGRGAAPPCRSSVSLLRVGTKEAKEFQAFVHIGLVGFKSLIHTESWQHVASIDKGCRASRGIQASEE